MADVPVSFDGEIVMEKLTFLLVGAGKGVTGADRGLTVLNLKFVAKRCFGEHSLRRVFKIYIQ